MRNRRTSRAPTPPKRSAALPFPHLLGRGRRLLLRMLRRCAPRRRRRRLTPRRLLFSQPPHLHFALPREHLLLARKACRLLCLTSPRLARPLRCGDLLMLRARSSSARFACGGELSALALDIARRSKTPLLDIALQRL